LLMQKCPHCGADNSVKREACYRCQQPLTPATEADPPAVPTAASRWEAIDLGKRRARRLRPAGGGSREQPTEETARERPRSYMPTFRRPLSHVRRMSVFFRELHTLTRSGITIAHACRELERRSPGNLGRLAGEMAAAAEAGDPIGAVMAQHQDLFYAWHIGLVGAAQAGGYLPEAFDQIAHAYEVEWQTRSALLSRLYFYLLFGLPPVLVVIPLILMLNEPIPKEGWTLQTAYATTAHFFRTVSLVVVVALAALALMWQALSSTAWFQGIQQRVVIRIPVVGRVARTAALDRYLATLGLLLRGGIPVAEAAEEAASAAGNAALAPRLMQVGAAVREGVSLAIALESTRAFDRDTLNLAATGEVSGSLPEMLSRAAGYYREEHEAKRKWLLRAAGVAFGVFWLCLVGAIAAFGLQVYFNFAFRTFDWMME